MNPPIITVCSHPEHATKLITSAEKHGWELVVIQCDWRGFGTKIIETCNYLKAHPEIEHFVFADAFDVYVMGSPGEFMGKIGGGKMLLSAEKGLWPPILHPFRTLYPKHEHGFNYVNSGLYYADAKFFIGVVDAYPLEYELDDQYYMNMIWLLCDNSSEIRLNSNQSVFNSHSFISEGEYTYENNRVQILGNQPCFLHFNGKSVDEKFNQMINI